MFKRVQSICKNFLELLSPEIWGDRSELSHLVAARTLLSELYSTATQCEGQLQTLALTQGMQDHIKEGMATINRGAILMQLQRSLALPLSSDKKLSDRIHSILQKLPESPAVQTDIKRLAVAIHWLGDAPAGTD